MAGATTVYVPAVAVGESYYGAQRSAQAAKDLKKVREFASRANVLDCDATTADHYGQIKNGLKAKGHPLPENDIWIAAVARQHSLTVVTRDRHFQEIDGLILEEW